MSEARSSKVSTGDYPIARLEARYPTNFYFLADRSAGRAIH